MPDSCQVSKQTSKLLRMMLSHPIHKERFKQMVLQNMLSNFYTLQTSRNQYSKPLSEQPDYSSVNRKSGICLVNQTQVDRGGYINVNPYQS